MCPDILGLALERRKGEAGVGINVEQWKDALRLDCKKCACRGKQPGGEVNILHDGKNYMASWANFWINIKTRESSDELSELATTLWLALFIYVVS